MEYALSLVGLVQPGLKRACLPFGFFILHLKDHFIPHHRNNYHPHLLGHRSVGLLSLLLVSVKIFALGAVAFGPAVPAFSSAITVENIISLTNESRREFGLLDLGHSDVLDKAAQAKAEDMLSKGYFAHTTPDGRTPWDFISQAGYNYLIAGENLAVNFTEAESVDEAWMNSAGHKANIINKNFEQIGIGIAQGQYQGHTAIFVVQMFGVPVEQKVALSEATTAVQKEFLPSPVKSAQVPTPSAETPGIGAGDLAGADKFEPVAIKDAEIRVDGENAEIIAQVTGPTVKVLAFFGEQAVMLSPKAPDVWIGQARVSVLAQSGKDVNLKVLGMDGQVAQMRMANFAGSTAKNFNSTHSSLISNNVDVLGWSFDPKSFESRFYLLFIAVMLSCLILAIAIKRHIHHVSFVANGSFVGIFAALLFLAG